MVQIKGCWAYHVSLRVIVHLSLPLSLLALLSSLQSPGNKMCLNICNHIVAEGNYTVTVSKYIVFLLLIFHHPTHLDPRHIVYTYIPHLHTYIPTYLHTNIPTYLHTYMPTHLHTYIPTYLHTYIPTYLLIPTNTY